MTNSSKIVTCPLPSDQNDLPSNRREVMKKGLRLTLGGGALGLAGLGASTSAKSETWESTVIVELSKNDFVYPLFDIVPNFFKNYIFKTKTSPLNKTRLNVSFSKTKNSNKVRGDVYMVYAPSAFFPKTTLLSRFYYERALDTNGRKAINGPVIFSYVLANSGCSTLFCADTTYPSSDQMFGSDEFRRRLAQTDLVPFEGDILTIYNKWKTLSESERSNFTVTVYENGNAVVIHITNMIVRADTNNNEAVTQIHLTFNASRLAITAPTAGPAWGAETIVNVWGLAAGGYGRSNYLSTARVTLPYRSGLPAQWRAEEYNTQMGAAALITAFSTMSTGFVNARNTYQGTLWGTQAACTLEIASVLGNLFTIGDVSYDNPSPIQATEIALGVSYIAAACIFSLGTAAFINLKQMTTFNNAARDYFNNNVHALLSSPFSTTGTTTASSSLQNWSNNLQNSANFNILEYLDITNLTPP